MPSSVAEEMCLSISPESMKAERNAAGIQDVLSL